MHFRCIRTFFSSRRFMVPWLFVRFWHCFTFCPGLKEERPELGLRGGKNSPPTFLLLDSFFLSGLRSTTVVPRFGHGVGTLLPSLSSGMSISPFERRWKSRKSFFFSPFCTMAQSSWPFSDTLWSSLLDSLDILQNLSLFFFFIAATVPGHTHSRFDL